MFQTSDSEDEDQSHTARMNIITSARRAEMKETFDEEMESFTSSRKRKKNSNESSSSDSDGDEDEDNDQQNSSHEEAEDNEPPKKQPKQMSVAERLMAKMGHKEGKGLGKEGQGRTQPVGLSTQRGRVGLGHEASKVVSRTLDEEWDEAQEQKTVEEIVNWMPKCNEHDRESAASECEGDTWIEIGKTKKTIDDETEFCSEERLKGMIEAKNVFDHLTDRELREARTRANPYETIGGAFFQNRAAMKAANLDKVFDWLFSGEDKETLLKKNPVNPAAKGYNTDRQKEVFYFADVCAGPGGFSEYMLWRKGFFNTKGFGFTLAGKDDFKLDKFNASSPHFFEAFYGTHNNGDVMNPENIDSLEDYVMKGTEGLGVHLMMADGGFSVEGQENIQEVLSKRLYLCQLLVSLCIVREGGNFFCKLFDIFTPFSVGLIYLMYVCYDQVCLHKPHTSRPANSERYIICKGLRREFSNRIKTYLKKVNNFLNEFKRDRQDDVNDVVSIVPLEIIKEDANFLTYLVDHNEKLAFRQEMYLKKYLSFARNQGQIDKDQGDLRDKCLEYWEIPNKQRTRYEDLQRANMNPMATVGQYTSRLIGDSDLSVKMPSFDPMSFLKPGDKQLKYAEYLCTLLTERNPNQPKLLVSAGTVAFIFDREWKSFDNKEMRIPDKTILLIEDSSCYRLEGNKLEVAKNIIRIIDVAVLHGDDVSKLSYPNRLKAAEKFCKVLQRVNPTIEESVVVPRGQRERRSGPPERERRKFTPKQLVTAKIYTTTELVKMRNDFRQVRHRGNETVIYEENGFLLAVTGVRFARQLKDEWRVGWSRSQRVMFAFEPSQESIFEADFERKDICAPFWDVALMKRKPNGEVRSLQQIWKWEASLNDDYGPRAIFSAPHHQSGPTLLELEHLITENKKRFGVPL